MKKMLVAFILSAFALIFFVQPTFLAQTGHEQLSAYGQGDDHVSELRRNLDGRNVTVGGEQAEYRVTSVIGTPQVLSGIADKNNTLFLVIGVEKKYSPVEADTILEFVKAGGKLIIADDTGLANEVSRPMGVSFYGQQFWDDKVQNTSDFPFTQANLSGQGYRLMTNVPTCLQVVARDKGDVGYIANSSSNAYCDVNPNGKIDIYDLDAFTRPIPLIVESRIDLSGNLVRKDEILPDQNTGHAVFIHDPGIFTNFAMGYDWDGDGEADNDNLDFSMAMVEYMLPQGGTVIFDESRHIKVGPTESMGLSIGLLGILSASTPMDLDLFGVVTVPFIPGFISLLILTGILVSVSRRATDKDSWVHDHNLDTPTYDKDKPVGNELQTKLLKELIYEKVRLAKSLSREEAEAMDANDLIAQMKQPELLTFYRSEKGVAQSQLEHITHKLADWKADEVD